MVVLFYQTVLFLANSCANLDMYKFNHDSSVDNGERLEKLKCPLKSENISHSVMSDSV